MEALINRYKEGCKAQENFKAALTVEKADKGTYTMDGAQVSCKGYNVTVSKDSMIEFIRQSSDFFLQDETLKADFMRQLETTVKMSELMGGTMSFTSILGQGTTFTIRLPFEKCKRSEIPQAVRVDAGDGDALQGLRVLLVEDNDLNAEIAQFTLARAGAVVTHAKDGESAVEMFAASAPHEYDVVLMDIMMPGIDGLEATRRIRALDREDAATTPIIAVSANAFADDRRLSREAGMNAHLSKSVSSQELVEALAHIAADAS